jgi:hypothetical protein
MIARQLARPLLGERVWSALRSWRERAVVHPRMRREDTRANRIARTDGPALFTVSEAGTPHAYPEFLAWLAEHDPALRERLWLAHLPSELPTHVMAMHAWVQDPVRERDPIVFEQLIALEARLRARGGTIVQPASVLSNSQRTSLEARLRDVGLRTPRTVVVRPTEADPFCTLHHAKGVGASRAHAPLSHRCRGRSPSRRRSAIGRDHGGLGVHRHRQR